MTAAPEWGGSDRETAPRTASHPASSFPEVQAYASKDSGYFSGVRRDYVEALPRDPAAVLLDIGCGTGATGALARAVGKCGTAYGIEIEPRAASIASGVLDEVLVGDVEALAFPWQESSVDVVILSEVLEHLRDPWLLLRRARKLLRPGALVFASSPNVAHHRIIRSLVRGRWTLADWGAMDRTHLRWFTPQSYRELFEQCGYAVDRVGPLDPLSRKARVADSLTLGRLTHLLHPQIDLRGHAPDR